MRYLLPIAFAVAFVIASLPSHADVAARLLAERHGYQTGYRRTVVAEADAQLCSKLQENRDVCESRWHNIGGGTDGQAGSFKQCYEMYQNAMIAAGCD